jgi:hypothetical protein
MIFTTEFAVPKVTFSTEFRLLTQPDPSFEAPHERPSEAQ